MLRPGLISAKSFVVAFNDLKEGVFVRYVDLFLIDDNHCLSFRYIKDSTII